MKKKTLAAVLIAVGLMMTGWRRGEYTGFFPDSDTGTDKYGRKGNTTTSGTNASSAAEESKGTKEEEVAPEHSYRSELTNEWIDEDLKDQRPIAVMVDNEKTALPHYGLTEADVVYEIMNSTLNDRITRFYGTGKGLGEHYPARQHQKCTSYQLYAGSGVECSSLP